MTLFAKKIWGFQISGAEVASLIFLVKHRWVLVSRISDAQDPHVLLKRGNNQSTPQKCLSRHTMGPEAAELLGAKHCASRCSTGLDGAQMHFIATSERFKDKHYR